MVAPVISIASSPTPEALSPKPQALNSTQVVAPVIIMYPKASVPYSIKTRRLMTETGIQLWLESLVSSRYPKAPNPAPQKPSPNPPNPESYGHPAVGRTKP